MVCQRRNLLSFLAGRKGDHVATIGLRPIAPHSSAEIQQYLAPLLLHFFNHQTHHRGQAHRLLTAIAGEAPSFDLLVFQRATGVSLVKGRGGSFTQSERRPTASA